MTYDLLLSAQALSSDPEYIVRALRKSSGNILEVNVEGTAVRRSPENPPPDIFSPEQRQKMKEKTVYVVGVAKGCEIGGLERKLSQHG